MCLVAEILYRLVTALCQLTEQLLHRRMADRLSGQILEQILLRHVSNIGCIVILGQQMVVGLILSRADILRNRLIPLFAIAELRIHVKYDSPEWE